MNDLDILLKQFASHPIPPAPKNLEDAVWREIRRRRDAPVRASLFDRLAFQVWQRYFAAGAVTAALVFGGAFGWLSAPEASTAQPAALALNLGVFSEHSPATRLASLYQQP